MARRLLEEIRGEGTLTLSIYVTFRKLSFSGPQFPHL